MLLGALAATSEGRPARQWPVPAPVERHQHLDLMLKLGDPAVTYPGKSACAAMTWYEPILDEIVALGGSLPALRKSFLFLALPLPRYAGRHEGRDAGHKVPACPIVAADSRASPLVGIGRRGWRQMCRRHAGDYLPYSLRLSRNSRRF